MKTQLFHGIAAAAMACAFAAAAQNAPQDTPSQVKPAVPPVSAPTQPQIQTADSTAAATSDTTVLAPKDFMQQAYLANEFGIAASQLALQKAQTSDAKSAAQTILSDDMKVRQDMVTAIQGASSDMHFDQGWDDHYKGLMADLQNATGASFDQTYLATQSEVSSTTTGLYQSYAQTGSDSAVKTFAQATLPTLQAETTTLDSAASTSAGAAG